jgi:methyl-accepting chemotaxis protein
MLNKLSIGTIRMVAIVALFLVIAILGYSNVKHTNDMGRWQEQVESSGTNLGSAALRAAEIGKDSTSLSKVLRAEHRSLMNLFDRDGKYYPAGLSLELVLALLGAGIIASFGLWYVGRKEQELVDANQVLNRRLVEISTTISKHLPGGSINAAELGQDLPDEAMTLLIAFEDYAKKLSEAYDQAKRSYSESEASRKNMKQELDTAKENLEICKNVVHDCIRTISNATSSISSNSEEAYEKLSSRLEDMSSLRGHADKIIETYQDVMGRFAKSSDLNAKSVEHALLAQEKIESLKDAATRMGSVVDVITRIAEHTNHLALNATIEAARAGEAGKGFNVVATEVKDLSTQTSEEMKKISAQIVAIQSATGQSVAAIEDVVQTTKEVSALAIENSKNPVDEDVIKRLREISENTIELISIQHYRDQIVEWSDKIADAIKNVSETVEDDK